MKASALLLAILLFFSEAISGQSQSFDVFNFQEPPGWKKETKNGVIIFTTTDAQKNTYCMIGLYASRKGSGNLQQDFKVEWDKIALPLGVTDAPQKQDGEETNGWKLITGTSTFKIGGGTSAVMLNTFSSPGKTASILFSFNDAGYQKALEDFSSKLVIAAAAASVPQNNNPTNNNPTNSNTSAGSGSFIYAAPKGWIENKTANGNVAIASPLLECKDYSYYTIHLLGKSTYTGSLQQYAHDLHKTNFYQQNDWRQYMEGDKRVVKGIDANGYEFLSYETSAALFNSDRNYHYGMVYLLRSGDQMVSIILELRPINGDKNSPPTESLYFLANCSPLRSAWNKFIASIRLPGTQQTENYVPDDLLGKWESRIILGATNWGLVNSQVLEKYTFMEDGRYQSSKMLAGNTYGKFSVSGNKLTVTDATGKTTAYKFKLESKFEYGSWHRELTLFDATGKESTLRWEGE